jgi:hypothetical protein
MSPRLELKAAQCRRAHSDQSIYSCTLLRLSLGCCSAHFLVRGLKFSIRRLSKLIVDQHATLGARQAITFGSAGEFLLADSRAIHGCLALLSDDPMVEIIENG